MQRKEAEGNIEEKIIRVDYNLTWLPEPNESQIALSSQLPPQELVATALVVAFAGDRLLTTNLVSRGWDIPGGHVEPGEHPEETVRREVLEETGATLGELHLLGYQRLRLLGPEPASYDYPYPDCYQVFYWAQVISLADFLPTPETQGRALVPPSEARALPWVRHNGELYETALYMVIHKTNEHQS
jgi:8-oxo-dGTP diphosphatase